jgi:hypothetical protein
MLEKSRLDVFAMSSETDSRADLSEGSMADNSANWHRCFDGTQSIERWIVASTGELKTSKGRHGTLRPLSLKTRSVRPSRIEAAG